MAAWVAPLISAGAGLIGKLFGGKDDNKSSNRVDYKQMVRDAEAAGFNPLTVLRAGGAAGYTTTHHPALSSVNTVGAIAEAVGNFAMNYDANKATREQAEFDLVQAQIANIQTETAQRKAAMLAVPKRIAGNAKDATGRPVADVSKSPLMSLPWATAISAPATPERGDTTITNPNQLRQVYPGNTDAEAHEARGGEWTGNVQGLLNTFNDVFWDERQRAIKRGGWVTTKKSTKPKSWWPSFSVEFDRPYDPTGRPWPPVVGPGK